VSSEPLTIRPSSPWRGVNFRELWEFRDLILILGRRDIQLRYRQTALGAAWVVFQPLLGAAIFAFVFGRVAKLASGGVPYFLFALIGMVAWGGFSGALTRASTSLLQNPQLIAKIFFPRLVLPISALLSVGVDLAVGLSLATAAMVSYGVMPSWRLLTLPLWLFLTLALALGVGFFASALAVRYRDMNHVLPVLIQLGFYATPVAYSVEVVPERYRAVFLLNPIAPLMEATRWSLLGQGTMSTGHLLYAALFSGVALGAGALFFRRAERSFADVI
jgi:lipopolysaccharide transport system permease protein